MSNFQRMCGAHNFAVNVILEFLELVEIVKILTIVHRNRLNFIPSPALLENILLKALSFSSSSITFCSDNQNKETKLNLLMISEEKTLTLHTL
jgi:hypothetical protein